MWTESKDDDDEQFEQTQTKINKRNERTNHLTDRQIEKIDP